MAWSKLERETNGKYVMLPFHSRLLCCKTCCLTQISFFVQFVTLLEKGPQFPPCHQVSQLTEQAERDTMVDTESPAYC
jgi:hypothetical protein